jgi:predicted dehydrogenase
MQARVVRFGIIGCGLMGREFASGCARWLHIDAPFARPEIVAVCDTSDAARAWFTDRVPTVAQSTDDYRALLANPEVEAVYCALPHNLHEQVYLDIIAAGKHLLGEKPFGIDKPANDRIMAAIRARPEVFVRCSSEFPFFPGAQEIVRAIRADAFGRIIEVEAGFLHASDLDPTKVINWKRMIRFNGAYGCLGDLGMHVLHIPLRAGWVPDRIVAKLSKIVTQRPDGKDGTAPCETWDNGTILGEVATKDGLFPITFHMKRIAPGETNTWFLRVIGTRKSMEFSTKFPKTLKVMDYAPGGEQAWRHIDLGYKGAYPSITGGIFEFGFADSFQQMWAAYLDELVNGPGAMTQPFGCVTPEETAQSHLILTAALESYG